MFLTHLDGGAFGNDPQWIEAAIAHALETVRACELDVRIVSFGGAAQAIKQVGMERAMGIEPTS